MKKSLFVAVLAFIQLSCAGIKPEAYQRETGISPLDIDKTYCFKNVDSSAIANVDARYQEQILSGHSLWMKINPKFKSEKDWKLATVALTRNHKNELLCRLLDKNGIEIDHKKFKNIRQQSHFSETKTQNNFDFRCVILWFWQNRKLAFGLSENENLRIIHDRSGLMFLVMMPITGADGTETAGYQECNQKILQKVRP